LPVSDTCRVVSILLTRRRDHEIKLYLERCVVKIGKRLLASLVPPLSRDVQGEVDIEF